MNYWYLNVSSIYFFIFNQKKLKYLIIDKYMSNFIQWKLRIIMGNWILQNLECANSPGQPNFSQFCIYRMETICNIPYPGTDICRMSQSRQHDAHVYALLLYIVTITACSYSYIYIYQGTSTRQGYLQTDPRNILRNILVEPTGCHNLCILLHVLAPKVLVEQ